MSTEAIVSAAGNFLRKTTSENCVDATRLVAATECCSCERASLTRSSSGVLLLLFFLQI